MFGTLPLEAVRQIEDETGEAVPLVFARRQKLIDDDLGAVQKVPELSLQVYPET